MPKLSLDYPPRNPATHASVLEFRLVRQLGELGGTSRSPRIVLNGLGLDALFRNSGLYLREIEGTTGLPGIEGIS